MTFQVTIGKISEIVTTDSVATIGKCLLALGYKKGTKFHWRKLD